MVLATIVLFITCLCSTASFCADNNKALPYTFDRTNDTLSLKPRSTLEQFTVFCIFLASNKYYVAKLEMNEIYFLNTQPQLDLFLQKLPRSIAQSLVSLNLRHNGLHYTTIITLLKTIPALEELDISENNLGCIMNPDTKQWRYATNDDLKALAPVFASLKKLHMNDCGLLGHQMKWMIDFLKTNTKLEELHLAKNYLHIGAFNPAQDLINAANTENNPLKLLDLSQSCGNTALKYSIKRKNLKILH